MRKYCSAIALLALVACSASTGDSLPTSVGELQGKSFAQPNGYAQLYSFKGMPDGAYPMKRLLNVNGVLYGVTSQGGTIWQPTHQEAGTVFKWSSSRGESVVYVFQGAPDGMMPQAGLISVKGDLYGTTPYGGDTKYDAGKGTIFKISGGSEVESILFRFNGPRVGMNPYSGLVYVKGLLYGTTNFGGAIEDCDNGCGTVYSVSLAGIQKVLYRFKGGTDGVQPGPLIYRNGKFYGTAAGGAPYYSGHGVVFEVTPTGRERILYRFKGEPDGAGPGSGLTDVNGEFYGTTVDGGAKLGGTVYKIDSAGNEGVIYSFPRNSSPGSGLLYVNGALYGTTYYGGVAHHGTVFKVTLDGKGSTVYTFSGKTDGRYPTAGLIRVNNMLYGTTSQGGASDNGTLFRVSP
jgi:uncharacterized repeat protein (TIGR03803 family)